MQSFSANLEAFLHSKCRVYLRDNKHDALRRWSLPDKPVYIPNAELATHALVGGNAVLEFDTDTYLAPRALEMIKLMTQFYMAYHATSRKLEKYKNTQELLITLKTPLSTLLDTTQLLAREIDHRYIHTIMQCGLRIIAQLNDIIDRLKLQAQAVVLTGQHFRLHKILDEVIEFARITAEARRVTISLIDVQRVAARRYMGDPLRVRQILQVIVNNAVKYTNVGTIVVIRLTRVDDNIVIHVCDNGPGIPANKRASIFKLSDSSTLNLINAYNLARLMNGSVTLDPDYRPGSSFVISIPLPLSSEELNVKLINGKSVLIVGAKVMTDLATQWCMMPQVCERINDAKMCLAHTCCDIIWLGVRYDSDIEFAAWMKHHYPRTKVLGVSRIGRNFSGEHHFDRLVEFPLMEYDVLESTIALVGESKLCETFPRFEKMLSNLAVLQYHNVLLTSECPPGVIDMVQIQLTDVVSHSKVLHKETVEAWLHTQHSGGWSCFITTERALALVVTEQYKSIQCILLTSGHTGVLTPQIQEVDVSQVSPHYLRQQLQRAAQESFRSRFD
jgi:signal transduction histidine kinase